MILNTNYEEKRLKKKMFQLFLIIIHINMSHSYMIHYIYPSYGYMNGRSKMLLVKYDDRKNL